MMGAAQYSDRGLGDSPVHFSDHDEDDLGIEEMGSISQRMEQFNNTQTIVQSKGETMNFYQGQLNQELKGTPIRRHPTEDDEAIGMINNGGQSKRKPQNNAEAEAAMADFENIQSVNDSQSNYMQTESSIGPFKNKKNPHQQPPQKSDTPRRDQPSNTDKHGVPSEEEKHVHNQTPIIKNKSVDHFS